MRYMQLNIYSEWKKMNTFVDKVKSWFDDVENSNWRLGINGWMNSSNTSPFNQETYLDLSYHNTNFGSKEENNFFILTLSPRIFYRYKKYDFYINGEIVKDFLNKGKWNRNPFSNNLKGIIGIRKIFTFDNVFKITSKKIFIQFSFLLFAEYSKIKYLSKKDEWPWKTDLAKYDFRIGFVIYWPLGQSLYRPIGQNPL